MDSNPRPNPQGRPRTREERRSLSESLADGTSKFFSSVIAKKNGLFSDISKQIETTFSSSGPAEGGRRSSKDDTPPGTPPPRPPPPRKPPNVQEMREKEKIIKRMSSMPAYPRSDSVGSSSGRQTDRQLSMNGMNISFDEPLYSRNSMASSESAGGDERLSDASQFLSDTQFKSDIDESTARMMEAMNLSDPGKSKAAESGEAGMTQSPVSDSGSCHSDKGKARTDKVALRNADPSSTDGVHTRTKAPKFTTTKRRSSTVDEMLFDDYVEPEGGPTDTVFTPENLPSDLMSFDQDTTATIPADTTKVSPHPSQSSIDSTENATGGANNAVGGSASVESSDVEYGGMSVHRSASMGSEKSWSSTYSLDSQPDEVTLECMEFMKTFVDKVFSVE